MSLLIRKAAVTVKDYVFQIYIPIFVSFIAKSRTLQVEIRITYVTQNPTVFVIIIQFFLALIIIHSLSFSSSSKLDTRFSVFRWQKTSFFAKVHWIYWPTAAPLILNIFSLIHHHRWQLMSITSSCNHYAYRWFGWCITLSTLLCPWRVITCLAPGASVIFVSLSLKIFVAGMSLIEFSKRSKFLLIIFFDSTKLKIVWKKNNIFQTMRLNWKKYYDFFQVNWLVTD